MRRVLLACLLIAQWALCAQSLVIPTHGRVHLVSSLPQQSSQLSSVESLLASADVTRSLFQRNLRRLCDAVSTLKNVGSNDLVVVVGEQIDGFCDGYRTPGSFIQIQFTGEMIQAAYRSGSNVYPRTAPRGRFELASVLKVAFYDILMDDFFYGGDIDVYSITASPKSFLNSLYPTHVPFCLSVIIGVVLCLVVQSYFFPQGNASSNDEVKAIQMELEAIKPAELRNMPKVEYSGRGAVPHTPDQFRKWMKMAVELLIDYISHPEVYTVTTKYKPGFIHQHFPNEAPLKAEPFSAILSDIYSKILPGMTHWQHPRFHAYFSSGCSYPDVLADTIVSGFGIVSFNWDSSPAYAEIEVGVINWLGRAFNLPESFLFQGDNTETSPGGGAMQDSASDCVLVSLLAARHKRIGEITGKTVIDKGNRDVEHTAIKKLVAYSSTEAHSCIEKAALLALVHMRPITPNDKLQLTGAALEKQIQKDLECGLIPFFVHVTSGTTGTGAFDRLDEVVIVAKKYNLWVHVDGAYGGTSWLLPEMRDTQKGIEHVDSININLHKVFLHSSSASCLWTRHQQVIKTAMNVDPPYLKKRYPDSTDFRNFGIPLTRRQRCMKAWFVLRMYGIDGMKAYINQLIKMSRRMHEHLARDSRLEIIGYHSYTVSAFRLKCANEEQANNLTKDLADYITKSLKLAVTFAHPFHKSVVRINISHQMSLEKEIDESYNILSGLIDEFLLQPHKGPTSQNLRFQYDNGVVGSPNLTTQSTMSGASTSDSSVSRTKSRVAIAGANNEGTPSKRVQSPLQRRG